MPHTNEGTFFEPDCTCERCYPINEKAERVAATLERIRVGALRRRLIDLLCMSPTTWYDMERDLKDTDCARIIALFPEEGGNDG